MRRFASWRLRTCDVTFLDPILNLIRTKNTISTSQKVLISFVHSCIHSFVLSFIHSLREDFFSLLISHSQSVSRFSRSNDHLVNQTSIAPYLLVFLVSRDSACLALPSIVRKSSVGLSHNPSLPLVLNSIKYSRIAVLWKETENHWRKCFDANIPMTFQRPDEQQRWRYTFIKYLQMEKVCGVPVTFIR